MNQQTNVVSISACRAAKAVKQVNDTSARRKAAATGRMTLKQSIRRDEVRQRTSAAL